ncbi:MAG: hypothetical protein F2790_00910 [Actinobacteria bacterium]|nr:hypothetical protein [Actinomycetota bacterium]
MQKLVGSVGGTMDQHPYSALSVVDANHAIQGVTWRKQVHFSNLPLRVQIDNRLGENHNYHWVAMQGWRVLSSGTVFLESNSSREIGIPVVAASAGMVTVALDGGSIYVRVPISIPGRAQDVKIQP